MKEWGKGQSPDRKQTAVNHLCGSGSKMSTVQVGKGTLADSTHPAPYVGAHKRAHHRYSVFGRTRNLRVLSNFLVFKY